MIIEMKEAIFTRADYGYCDKAKKMLDQHKIPYSEIKVGRIYDDNGNRINNPENLDRLQRLLPHVDHFFFPQVFLNGIVAVGGSTDLAEFIDRFGSSTHQ